MKDYNFSLQHHPKKSNVVVDPLSIKPYDMLAALALEVWSRSVVIGDYNLKFNEDENVACVYSMVATLELLKQVQESQFLDKELYGLRIELSMVKRSKSGGSTSTKICCIIKG